MTKLEFNLEFKDIVNHYKILNNSVKDAIDLLIVALFKEDELNISDDNIDTIIDSIYESLYVNTTA